MTNKDALEGLAKLFIEEYGEELSIKKYQTTNCSIEFYGLNNLKVTLWTIYGRGELGNYYRRFKIADPDCVKHMRDVVYKEYSSRMSTKIFWDMGKQIGMDEMVLTLLDRHPEYKPSTRNQKIVDVLKRNRR